MSVLRVGMRALCLGVLLASGIAGLVPACSSNGASAARDGDTVAEVGVHKVKHVIVVMMENHSFDNYFGALAYAPSSPYHGPAAGGAGCDGGDHRCVDGLRCAVGAGGAQTCSNANLGDDG